MNAVEAIERIRMHAGFVASPPNAADIGMLIYEAKNGRPLGDIEIAAADIVRCLSLINLEINAPIELPGESKIPGSLVSAISQIVCDCIEFALRFNDEKSAKRMLTAAWIIQLAWNAVAAGDIDDIEEHVRLERGTRLPGR